MQAFEHLVVYEASRLFTLYFLISTFAVVSSCVFQSIEILTIHGKLHRANLNIEPIKDSHTRLGRIIARVSTLCVSKKQFVYFYLLGICVTICCLCLTYLQHIRLLMFLIHNLRRYTEEKYICVHNTKYSRMGVLVFIYGLSYYLVMPITITTIPEVRSETAPYQLFFFTIFSVLQSNSHIILSNIRKDRSVDYGIPFGGLFRYVSCPHYLCEVGIYLSIFFDILGNIYYLHVQLGITYVIICMFINASRTHNWYITRYRNSYTVLGRKAILPFVF